MAEGGARLLVANLDGEEDLALLADAGTDGYGGTRLKRRAWTRQALATAAGAGTLLRAFARPGDRLWTLAPVDETRVAEVPGLPRPELVSGPLARQDGAGGGLLAWCETPAVRKVRGAVTALAVPPGGEDLPLHELLWDLSAARATPPAVVARVHHRAFCLEIQQALGCALPGARRVGSLAELEAHLAAGAGAGSGAGWRGSWVVKAPLSAAGRHRAVCRRDLEPLGLERPELRRRIEALFRRHGALLFEPWMNRVADFGAAGVLLPSGVRWLGWHRQDVDARGQFTGITLPVGGGAAESLVDPERSQDAETAGRYVGTAGTAGTAGVAGDERIAGAAGDAGDVGDRGDATGLSAADRRAWQRCLDAVAGALAAAGYHGPFGVDAWQYRDAAGEVRFHPLGEINARLTFGAVARALVERLRGPCGLVNGDRVDVAFGAELPAGGERQSAVVPLLLPGPAGEPASWLAIHRTRRAAPAPQAVVVGPSR